MPDLRARSNVEIIDAAFQLYSRNFPLYFALGLLGSIPALFNIAGPRTMERFINLHTGLFTILAIVGVIVAFIMYGAYIFLTSELYHDRTVDLGQVLGKALSRFIPVFIAYLLSSIVITIGFFLLIIPGIILLFRLCLVLPVTVLEEDRRGTDPLYRSAALTKGHAWKIFLMGLALFVILIAGFAIQKLFPALLPNAIGMVVAYLAAAAINPLVVVIGTLFYYDLRIRNEGYDIQALATNMAPAPAAS